MKRMSLKKKKNLHGFFYFHVELMDWKTTDLSN